MYIALPLCLPFSFLSALPLFPARCPLPQLGMYRPRINGALCEAHVCKVSVDEYFLVAYKVPPKKRRIVGFLTLKIHFFDAMYSTVRSCHTPNICESVSIVTLSAPP